MENKTKVIVAWLKSNPPKVGEWGYYKRVAEKFGSTPESVRKMASRNAIPHISENSQAIDRIEEPLSKKIYTFLKTTKQVWNLIDLANEFNVAPRKIEKALEGLHGEGFNIKTDILGVHLGTDIRTDNHTNIDISKLSGKTFKFGLTSDNHLGSKYARLDVLNALFDIYEKEGITTVYQLGNMVEGEARFNKYDILAYGIEGQTDYFIKNWAERKGIVTQFITADDHEGWWIQREGIDYGRYLENRAKQYGRKDLVYLGHMEHNIEFKGKKQTSIMRLIHAGGGSAYAKSYSVQKILESYSGGEKPHILLVGHYHKSEFSYIRNTYVVQAGSTKDQDPFLRKNKIQVDLGGWIIEFQQNDDGIITKFTPTWIPFYDKEFYKEWKYARL